MIELSLTEHIAIARRELQMLFGGDCNLTVKEIAEFTAYSDKEMVYFLRKIGVESDDARISGELVAAMFGKERWSNAVRDAEYS